MRPAFLLFLVLIVGLVVGAMILDARMRSMRAARAIPVVTVPVDEPAFDAGPSSVPPVAGPSSAAAAGAAPEPSPIQAPVETDRRPARPRIDVTSLQKAYAPRFDRVLRRFYPGDQDPPDAELKVVFKVASDGRVVDAHAEDSSFRNPDFEAALVEEMKRTKYPEDDRYRTTAFIFQFRSVKPLPQRPIAEIEAVRELLEARIERRRRVIFASAPPPAGARMTVAYRVSPRGTVDEARVDSSTFHSAAFERAVVAEIRKLSFSANKGYAASGYSYRYGAPAKHDGNKPPKDP